MSFNERLTNFLSSFDKYISEEGKLLRDSVIKDASTYKESLINALIENEEFSAEFFVSIDDNIKIFKAEYFCDYLKDKNFLDNSYTKFQNKIGFNVKTEIDKNVVLVWTYKDCILEGGQTEDEQKRKEIFFNITLAKDEITKLLKPKALTNFQKWTKDGQVDFTGFTRDAEINEKRGLSKDTITDNLLIKGNNLLALHSIEKEFKGKVKLIYIDPPYNAKGAADTFMYNNNFKHSSWLTFMKNRLKIAYKFLRDDGFIAITIDHSELFYLGVLADEIFGRHNRVGIVSILINPKGRQHERFFSASTEYMLVYAKNESISSFNKVAIDEEKKKEFIYSDTENGKYRLDIFARIRNSTRREAKPDFFYPIYVSQDLETITSEYQKDYHEVFPVKDGVDYTWKVIKETFEERLKEDFYVAKEENGFIIIYNKYYEQQVLHNVWDDEKYLSDIWNDKKYFPEFNGTQLLKKLFKKGESVFSYPKSLYAVLDTLKIMTSDNDIIMDFFAGSGTTAHATMELNKDDKKTGNRQFICIEQMDYVESVTKQRINNAIEQDNYNSEFIYMELHKYNQIYFDKLQEAKDKNDLLKIYDEMSENAFFNYNVDMKAIGENREDFEKLEFDELQELLLNFLNYNMLYQPLSSLEDESFGLSKNDIQYNKVFYKIKENG